MSIIPISSGRSRVAENLSLVCPSCHRAMDDYQPREIEFIDYLARLLRSSSDFRSIQIEPLLGHDSKFRADLAGERKTPSGWENIVIECKNASVLSGSRLRSTVEQLQTYKNLAGERKIILAFPGRIPEKYTTLLIGLSIEIWDIDFISSYFQRQIEEIDHPYFQKLFLSMLKRQDIPEESKLIQELAACAPGKSNWSVYQKLAGRTLENLFCPPLESPKSELPDLSGFNRRDFVFPNYAPDGFWLFMREKYHADYIVVDAKNYKGKVKKRDVLQIANYLKPHGAGLFGLILSRTGGDSGCDYTAREQWMAHGKMIVILNDPDIEAMLLSKMSGGNPEKIIGQKIEEFRLSI